MPPLKNCRLKINFSFDFSPQRLPVSIQLKIMLKMDSCFINGQERKYTKRKIPIPLWDASS